MSTRPDKNDALRTLQPFQRRTVDHVVDRLFDPNGSRRFLVADEVGLGKTLVARGVIAEFVDRNWDDVPRIDVVYLCSNAALARENLAKLRVGGGLGHVLPATRFTLLPRELRKLHSKLNFISVTPGTALSVRGGGRVDERRVLYQILRERLGSDKWLSNFFKNDVNVEAWRDSVKQKDDLDRGLCDGFLKNLDGSPELLTRLDDMRAHFGRCDRPPKGQVSVDQYRLLGDLRALLARTCIEALQPDLIILDEFQRFKDLLAVDDTSEQPSPVAELAQQLFRYTTPENARVAMLLLSATPYRMFTTAEGAATDDHYRDFLDPMRFLLRDDENFTRLERTLGAYRVHLSHAARGAPNEAEIHRDSLQEQLLRVMTRTERVGSTVERDSMVHEPALKAPLHPSDLSQFIATERIREKIDGYDVIDLWKSSPYLLNFMKKYKFKESFDSQLKQESLRSAFARTSLAHLTEDQVHKYERIDPGNARLRLLQQECLGNEQWKMLWLAPSQPYWPLRGAWEKNRDFTKKLVFSAWNVVPDAVSSLLSFEAERLQVGDERDYQNLYGKRRGLLTYALGDRPKGMMTLALQYPCLELAAIHPLSFPPASDVEAEMRARIAPLLLDAGIEPSDKSGDSRWYWAALLALEDDPDQVRAFLIQLGQGELKSTSGDGEHEERRGNKGLHRHAQEALAALDQRLDFGPVPSDLLDVLVDFALGSPAVLWARTLSQFGASPARQRSEGSRLGEAFRTLFNEPMVSQMLRGHDDESYWRLVLRYCFEGNLQAVFDEYAHLLWEPATWAGTSTDEAASAITALARGAVTTKTSRVRPDYYATGEKEITAQKSGVAIRTHFALRYGNVAASGEASEVREDVVREAFKSPFYPFVLISTSVGQEGLDFHPWCHSVWHWNLPGNPVDLEQREGRVHRYKGHAVRKNVAHAHGADLHHAWSANGGDPWRLLFDLALARRPAGSSDLVPGWLAPGPYKVERCIPLLPFSQEEQRLDQLKRSLAIYRVVFGQPRQEELLRLLSLGQATTEDLEKWVIKLEPLPIERTRSATTSASPTSTDDV